jgi:hypothetical protein
MRERVSYVCESFENIEYLFLVKDSFQVLMDPSKVP